jgi:AbrB family looped-hinge helix DNA binding protein
MSPALVRRAAAGDAAVVAAIYVESWNRGPATRAARSAPALNSSARRVTPRHAARLTQSAAIMLDMKIARISRRGQVSIPASVRNRWGTERVMIEDRGDALILRPLPDDPIGAALDLFSAGWPSTDEIRNQLRQEEAAQRP